MVASTSVGSGFEPDGCRFLSVFRDLESSNSLKLDQSTLQVLLIGRVAASKSVGLEGLGFKVQVPETGKSPQRLGSNLGIRLTNRTICTYFPFFNFPLSWETIQCFLNTVFLPVDMETVQ